MYALRNWVNSHYSDKLLEEKKTFGAVFHSTGSRDFQQPCLKLEIWHEDRENGGDVGRKRRPLPTGNCFVLFWQISYNFSLTDKIDIVDLEARYKQEASNSR